MNHELSPLTLDDIRETLSTDPNPDVLTQDWVNQISKIATESPGPTGNVTGLYSASDIKLLSTDDIGSLTYGGIGSLSAGTIGPYIYTTNGTSTTGINSVNPGNISIANTHFDYSGKVSLKGQNADIEINGKSMAAWMDKIEQRLNILTPNPDLEKEWDDLRRLGERYRKLEKKCQEKSQMWEALKKMKPPKL